MHAENRVTLIWTHQGFRNLCMGNWGLNVVVSGIIRLRLVLVKILGGVCLHLYQYRIWLE